MDVYKLESKIDDKIIFISFKSGEKGGIFATTYFEYTNYISDEIRDDIFKIDATARLRHMHYRFGSSISRGEDSVTITFDLAPYRAPIIFVMKREVAPEIVEMRSMYKTMMEKLERLEKEVGWARKDIDNLSDRLPKEYESGSD